MVTARNRNHSKNYNLREKDNMASEDKNLIYSGHKIHHTNPLKALSRESLKLQINKY